MSTLTPVRTTSGPIRGDGTTTRSRVARRAKHARWFLGILAAFLIVGLLLALVRAPSSATPLAPDNPAPNGSQALAHVLQDHGVDITYTRDASRAAREAGPGTTLLVVPGTTYDALSTATLRALSRTRADLALFGPDEDTLAILAPQLVDAYGYDTRPDLRCADPDAQAAGAVSVQAGGYLPTHASDRADVTLCFGFTDSAAGSYAVVNGSRRVAVYDDPRLITNKHVAEDGNAALALRMLGRNAHLVWLVPADPTDQDTSAASGPSTSDLLPPWAWALLGWSLVVAVVAALWRGRRFGPLVPDDLPVVVRAAETTLGRARLYRAGSARGHAAAGLRARTAHRLAARLGLPATTVPPALVAAVAAATGRPAPDIDDLLYGPPPPHDDALLALARRLDDLESEVHP